jgi:Ca2+-binding EF-hand superfamily protein
MALIAFTVMMFSVLSGPANPARGDEGLFDQLDSDKNGQLSAAEIPAEQRRLFDRLVRRGDTNHDQTLSRDEFQSALVPSRPEKPIEEKQAATSPQVSPVRWLLLAMDTNANARIEQAEVPEELRRVFSALMDPIDRNKNGVLETMELTRGGRPLARIAGRYVEQNKIDVAAELKKLDEKQGAAANRFEAGPLRLEDLIDRQKASQAFLQLDMNNDGQIEPGEVPDPLRRRLQRLLRLDDRNGDGRLSEREFISGVRRIAARAARQSAGPMSARDAVPKDAMPANER